MEKLLSFLTKYGAIGWLLALIGIVVNCLTYLKTRREKRPCWASRNVPFISEATSLIPRLDISYNGQKVESLSVTTFYFWNAGRDTILSSDLDTNNPLRIKASEEAEILGVGSIKATSKGPEFKILDEDRMSKRLQFKYLDQNQGAAFQIIHTGTSTQPVRLFGEIIGAAKGLEHKDIPFFGVTPEAIKKRRTFSALLFFVGIYAGLNGVFPDVPRYVAALSMGGPYWLNATMGVLALVFSVIISIWLWRRQMPKEFSAFEKGLPL